MDKLFRIIGALIACGWALSGMAQEAPAAVRGPSPGRLREIALRWAAPEALPAATQRELEAARTATEQKQPEAALRRWRNFLAHRDAPGPAFNPIGGLDYLLNRMAAARNTAANDACRRLRFYEAQENAIFEHVSTADKQLSAYAGADISAVPLREPKLSEYSDGGEPVTLAPGASVGAKELQASLDRWRERLPAIAEARGAAIDAFVKSVSEDATLAEEIQDLELTLRAEIKRH